MENKANKNNSFFFYLYLLLSDALLLVTPCLSFYYYFLLLLTFLFLFLISLLIVFCLPTIVRNTTIDSYFSQILFIFLLLNFLFILFYFSVLIAFSLSILFSFFIVLATLQGNCMILFFYFIFSGKTCFFCTFPYHYLPPAIYYHFLYFAKSLVQHCFLFHPYS